MKSDEIAYEDDQLSQEPNDEVLSKTGILWRPLLIITLVLVGAYPLMAWYGYHKYQQAGVTVVTIAAILCWFGSILGILPSLLIRNPDKRVNAILLGMLIRMSIPIGGGLMLETSIDELAEARLLMFTLIYYIIALVVDTALALKIVQASKQETKASC